MDLKAAKHEAFQLRGALAVMGKEIREVRKAADDTIHLLTGRIANLEACIKYLKHQRTILSKRNQRLTLAKQALKKRISEKRKTRPTLFRMMYQGRYTTQARALARLLVTSGTAEANVGSAIVQIGEALGVSVGEQRMSRRSVQRFMLERGVAADIQLAYEIIKSGRELQSSE
jgi:hypothetical protein